MAQGLACTPPAAGATTKQALHRTAAQTAPAALHARLARPTLGPWAALNCRPAASRLRRQHARAAACRPDSVPAEPPRRVSRLSVNGWQPPGPRTMPSCLCCEQKRPRPSPAWLKLGRLLQPSAAQRFCFTLTMPGRRCGEQYRPCARARPAAWGARQRARARMQDTRAQGALPWARQGGRRYTQAVPLCAVVRHEWRESVAETMHAVAASRSRPDAWCSPTTAGL